MILTNISSLFQVPREHLITEFALLYRSAHIKRTLNVHFENNVESLNEIGPISMQLSS